MPRGAPRLLFGDVYQILVTVDELPAWTGLLGPPSPKKLVDELKHIGFEAAIAVLPEPAILTDAPWDILLKAVKTVDPN